MKKDHQDNEQAQLDALATKILDARVSRRTLMSASAASAAMMLMPGMAKAQAASQPPKGRKGQIIVGVSQEPTIFHPLMPGIEVDQGVWFAMFNPLWHTEPDGSFVPDLAAAVPTVENGGISADGLQWKVKLRKGVKWHDGTDFTSEDVKFTLELINNKNFRAATRLGHGLVQDIKTNGPNEISWKMSKGYSPYLALLSWTFIVPKHILASATDPNATAFASAPVGTGPFKWSRRVAGQSVTLEANTNYFGDGPYVERVIWSYVPDANVLYTQFKTGQIDYAGYNGLLAHFYKEAAALPDRKVLSGSNGQIECIVMNFTKPQFADKNVRKALLAGINRKAIIDVVYYGLPQQAESYTISTSWAFNPNLPKQSFDVAAGSKLLEEAGWKAGSDGVRAKNGVKLEFAVATIAGNPQREQVLQLIQQDWKKMGVAMSIKTMPSAVVYGDYYTKSQFDALLLSSTFGTGADPDPTQRFSSTAIPVQGGGGQNFYQYRNAEVDRLLLIGQQTFKRNERKDAYWKIQAAIRDDLAILPICQPTVIEGTKAKLVGLRQNPTVRSNCWNIGSWYWKA